MMASAIVSAISTAVGRAVDSSCVSQQLVPDNNSIGNAVKLANPDQVCTISSILSGSITCIKLVSRHWGVLVLVANAYLVWAISSRHNCLKAIKKKYGFTKDPKTYQDMTVDVAQEVEKNLAEWEMPWLFELGWLFNFLAVSRSSPPSFLSLYECAHIYRVSLPFSIDSLSPIFLSISVSLCVFFSTFQELCVS